MFLVYLALAEAGIYLVLALARSLFPGLPSLAALMDSRRPAVSRRVVRRCDALLASRVLRRPGRAPRVRGRCTPVLNLLITPDKVYPLYGFRYRPQRVITRMTNMKFLNMLFGDSSYVVSYLRWLGLRPLPGASRPARTSGTFAHEIPYPVLRRYGHHGRRRAVVRQCRLTPARSFRVSRLRSGPQLLRQPHLLPARRPRRGTTASLATKVMVPVDGPVREGVGLLGSPPFEIPRTVERDTVSTTCRPGRVPPRLHAKNRLQPADHGPVPVSLAGSSSRSSVAGSWPPRWTSTADAYVRRPCWPRRPAVTRCVVRADRTGVLGLPTGCSRSTARSTTRTSGGRAATGSSPLAIYPRFFNGTPFKSLIWRPMGVRIGRRVFDDGCDLPDRTLVTIGDDCVLNVGSDHPVPFAGGRHLQVRPHDDRRPAAPSASAHWSTTA